MGKRCSAPIAHMCLQNIRYGCLDASDDDVIKAAEAACIHEAITTRFPRGYDTVGTSAVGITTILTQTRKKQRAAPSADVLLPLTSASSC
eukprot:scaffold21221_cov17-Tisochrysis_lutea.AAC.1